MTAPTFQPPTGGFFNTHISAPTVSTVHSNVDTGALGRGREVLPLTLSPTIITTIASVFSSLVVIFGAIFAVYRFVLRQNSQDKEIKKMKTEQTIVVYGLLACLRGLKESGIDGPVTDGIAKLEKHLNQQAHE